MYLPEVLKARLERVAQEKGISEAEAIRNAIDEFTAHTRPRPKAPLFSVEPIEDFDEAMRGFGED